MMKCILLLALCSVAFAGFTLESAFGVWMAEHGKSYTTEEYPIRFQNFKDSIDRIDALNAASDNAVFALNKFSDMSEEEFKNTILMRKNKIVGLNNADRTFNFSTTAPATLDWRKNGAVTAVKDQGQCGSCWAFSATEAIESAWILGKKATSSLNLAPQQIVDCDKQDGGCQGGWPEKAMAYIHSAGGQEGAANYPYTAKNGVCKFSAQHVEAKISGSKFATTTNDEKTLQNNLATWGPLSVCVDATSWNSYHSGVLASKQCCTSCVIDHCVQLVGYDTTANPPYWIVRNSWGAGWGLEGYIHLAMGGNTCLITNHATWPTL